MSARAGAKPGLVSRFAHLMGGTRPKAEDAPPGTDDVEDVSDDVEDVEDDVEDLEDRVDDLEDRVDDVEEGTPADAKAHKRGVAAGRKAERARCAAIFGAPEAGNNPTLAASLAFETSLPAKQALALLRAGGAAQTVANEKPGLRSRMAGVTPIQLGADNPNPRASNDTAFDLVMSSYALATGQKKEG